VVKKTRFNSALNNPLAQSLSSQSIKKVVISGFTTTGAIVSTSTYLSDLDYLVYVIEDNIIDKDDLDATDPNKPALLYNGTTLSHNTLHTVLANFLQPITLKAARAGLCRNV